MSDEHEGEHETMEIARKIRYDLTAAQVKVTELLNALAKLELPSDKPTCPACGVPVRGPNTLAEHVYHSHGGPVPESYLRAEAMSEEAA